MLGPRRISADRAGLERLVGILGEPGTVHVVMEATGHYWHNLDAALRAKGHVVSVVNAMIPARFAKMELRRAKTDGIDAVGLARYGATMRPEADEAPDEALRKIRELRRWRDSTGVTCDCARMAACAS